MWELPLLKKTKESLKLFDNKTKRKKRREKTHSFFPPKNE